MVEASNQQKETTVQMDNTVGGENLDVPHMDNGPSADIRSLSGELAVTVGEFNMDDLHMEHGNPLGESSNGTGKLAAEQMEDDKSVAVNSWDRLARLAFMSMAENRVNNDSDTAFGIHLDMPHMDVFDCFDEMRNASGEPPGQVSVTRLNLFLTIVGFILYIVDLGSDIATAIFLANNRQWWQATVTLAFVYGAVIFNTIVKWRLQKIQFTGTADRLCYVASLLVNWPDMKQYWDLCRLEWQLLHKSPVKNARLVSEWHRRSYNVAYLKFMDGLCEACPQAMLQLYLLVPNLYGDWTWTDYLRIVGASVSLCTAGAALVNWEKFRRISTYNYVLLSELVVLHVWAVPVTVPRLLSVGLLLSVHPHWALAGVVPHLVLHGVYWCKTEGVPRALNDVIFMGLSILLFCMSPFDVEYSVKYRRVSHAIHLLGNTAMMIVWALGTPLLCVHPALYTAIICLNAVMFTVGLVGWQVHEKHWPDRYLI